MMKQRILIIVLVLGFFLVKAHCVMAVQREDGDAIAAITSDWLDGIEGVWVDNSEDGTPVIRGKIYRKSDYERIQKLLRRYSTIKNETELSEKVSAKLPKSFPRSSSTKIEPSIYFEMILAEIKTGALDHMGARLPKEIGLNTTFNGRYLSNPTKSLTVSSDPVRGFLDLALQNGDARIHAKQALIIQNAQWGEFHVGGEFPIKSIGNHFSKVEFKEFGFIIKCLPKLQSPPFIHLLIDSEISDIDTGSSVDGLPVISKKHLKTQVFTKLNEMVAIGGMIRSVESITRDQVPGLHLIPGLGRLFESNDFKTHKTEAYIFISPRKMEEGWMPNSEMQP
jgi:Flp pilus assembly secretin CpaC